MSAAISDLCRGHAEINGEHFHASDDGQSRLQDVAIDDCPKLHLFLFCVTTLMQNSGEQDRKEEVVCLGANFINPSGLFR